MGRLLCQHSGPYQLFLADLFIYGLGLFWCKGDETLLRDLLLTAASSPIGVDVVVHIPRSTTNIMMSFKPGRLIWGYFRGIDS